MTEDIKPEVIKKTHDVLGKHIKKPQLTEKLLKKPPFRFLHDIVTNVIKDTGFLKGLFTEEELNHENIKDRDGKLAFLDKLINCVKLATGASLSVKSSKIVAGLEPTRTNELLQAIGLALDNKTDSSKAVQDVLNKNTKKGSVTEVKKKEKSSEPGSSGAKHDSSKREKKDVSGSGETKKHEKKDGPSTGEVKKHDRKDPSSGKVPQKVSDKRSEKQEDSSEVKKRSSSHQRATKDSHKSTSKTGRVRKDDSTEKPEEKPSKEPKEDPVVKTKESTKTKEEPIKTKEETKRKEEVTKTEEKTKTEEATKTEEDATKTREERTKPKEEATKTKEEATKTKEEFKETKYKENKEKIAESQEESLKLDRSPKKVKEKDSITQRTTIQQEPIVTADTESTATPKEPPEPQRPVSALGRRRTSAALPRQRTIIDEPLEQKEIPLPSTSVKLDESPAPSVNKMEIAGPDSFTAALPIPTPPSRAPTALAGPSRSSNQQTVSEAAPIPLVRPRTAARQGSARPGAPRLRNRGEVALVSEEQVKPTAVNLIVEADGIKEDEDEDENLVVLENTTITESNTARPDSETFRPSSQQGHLVTQILETQKELETGSKVVGQTATQAENSTLGSKVEINWEASRQRERGSALKDVQRLCESIQTVTRAAHPIGKLLDSLQEDVDSMQQELEQWQNMQRTLEEQLLAEEALTIQSTEPLKEHLQQLQQAVHVQREQLSASKANILANDQRIHKLLAGGDTTQQAPYYS